MIQAATLNFLKDLAKNNNKEWMDKNRAVYESAKEDFLAFTTALLAGISAKDESIAEANLVAKNCVSRLNRDIRFSKDKTPYKTNFFAMISKGGKKGNTAGYYFQMQPGGSFSGGGVYMPMPPDLFKFRQEIDYNFEEWKKIVEGKVFKKTYPNGVQSPENLVRTPKGFEDDSPAIDYIKQKGFYCVTPITDEVLQSKNAVKTIVQSFATVTPLLDFLNRGLE
jgi:uncharacterized protein (TIGR02453 family)